MDDERHRMEEALRVEFVPEYDVNVNEWGHEWGQA
jgi:hypothetical protein